MKNLKIKLQKYFGETLKYYSVGTLGDNQGDRLTCSINTAYNMFDKHIRKVSYPTFEEAINAVKRGEINICIVPVSYPKINAFIADLKIKIIDQFFDDLPNLVLAGLELPDYNKITTLYLHPATKSIVPECLQHTKFVYVNSNSEACRRLLEHPQNALAITNELSAIHYKLLIVEILRENLKMPFVMFGKKDEL